MWHISVQIYLKNMCFLYRSIWAVYPETPLLSRISGILRLFGAHEKTSQISFTDVI